MSIDGNVRARLTWVVVLLTLSAACNWNVGSVDIKLVYTSDTSKSPLDPDKVRKLRLTVTGAGMDRRVEEFAAPLFSGGLADVPAGRDRVVTVEGINTMGIVVSRGMSAPFDADGGNIKVFVFISLTGEFSPPPLTLGDDEWKESYKTEMYNRRVFHAAELFPGGQVLVTGGVLAPAADDFIGPVVGDSLRSMDRFDGYAGAFLKDESADCAAGKLCMKTGRAHHTMNLLSNNTHVLITGGEPEDDNWETYEIATSTFWQEDVMTQPLSRQACASLPDEGVVIAGGIDAIDSSLSDDLELYTNGVFAEWKGILSQPRAGAVAVAYPGDPGGVLVIGGWQQWGDPAVRQASDVVDRVVFKNHVPEVTSFSLNHARADHTAVLLQGTKDPQVLVCGGRRNRDEIVSQCETLDPLAATSTDSNIEVARWRHTATVLANGWVLIAGGFTSTGTLLSARQPALLLKLPGKIEIQGIARRAGHTATLLPNGMVVLIGGVSQLGPGANVELPDGDYEIFNPRE
ncbi:MAG TPA: hypothetical protein VM425_02180 [Myxococcota bacterium]|nr:hypothetical protein [Myxococcota bacterium]